MDSGWWRLCLALLPGLGWLGLRGVDLAHSDLSIQRTLVEVRRRSDAFAGDLVADHASAHPGLWLDLLAYLPPDDRTAYLLTTLLGLATLLLAGAYLRRLGSSWGPILVGALALVLSRDLPGFIDTLPSAPISRAAVVVPILACWALAGSARDRWAGVLAGVALAIHPTLGASGMLLGAAMSTRPLRLLVLGAGVAAPVLAPAAAQLSAFSPGQVAAVAWRWGHHLDLMSSPAPAVLCLAWLIWAGLRAEPSRRRPARVAAGVLLGSALLAHGLRSGWLAPELARLHPLHAAVPIVWWTSLDAARTLARKGWLRRVVLAAVLLTVGVRSPEGWRSTPRPVPDPVVRHLATVPADQLVVIAPGETAWARLQVERGVFFSTKDGGEVISDRGFADRWSARLHASCGRTVPPVQWSPGPGWTRARRACERPVEVSALALGRRVAVLQLRDDRIPPGWKRLASEGGWNWLAPVAEESVR